MITINYITSLYSFAYSIIGLAAQDNIRYTKNDWYEYKIGVEVFHDDICCALSMIKNF